MLVRLSGARALKRFRRRIECGAREAGRVLGVSHASVLAWESGQATPIMAYRIQIELWTQGEIPRSVWTTKRERYAARAIAYATLRTGTDG